MSIRQDVLLLVLLMVITMSPFLGPLLQGESISLASFLYNDSLYHSARPKDYERAVRLLPYQEATIDTARLFYPYDIYSAERIPQGHLPLWNPYNGAGMPLLANFQSSSFSPLKLILVLFPSMRAYDYYLLMRLLCAACFAYILARALKRSPQASFLTGVTYGLAGYLLYHFQMVEVTSSCYAPLQFLAAERWTQNPGSRTSVFLGMTTAIMVLSGHPEPSALIILGSMIYAFARALRLRGLKVWTTTALGLFGAMALGLLISAFVILPFFEFLHYGFSYKFYMKVRLPLFLIFLYQLPFVFVPMKTPVTHGPGTYVGLVSLALAFFALLPRKRNYEVILILLIPLGMAFAMPPMSLVWWIPHFDLSWSGYSLPLFALGMALLAGEGLDFFTLLPKADRYLRNIGIVFFLVLIIFPLLMAGMAGLDFSLAFPLVFKAFWRQYVLALAIVAYAVILMRWKKSVPAWAKRWALPALACIDLLSSGWGYNLSRPGFDFPLTPAVDFLKSHLGHSRIIGLYGSNNFPNTGMVHGLTDLRAFDAIHVLRYREFMMKADPTIRDTGLTTILTNQPINPMWDLMGVRFVLQSTVPSTLYQNKYTRDFPTDVPPYVPQRLTSPSLKPVYADEGIIIYENLRAYPRAFVVHRAVFVANEEESYQALDKIVEGALNAKHTAIVEVADPQRRRAMEQRLPHREPKGEALPVIEAYGPEEVRVAVEMKAPGFLILTDTYYPGWVAEVDGHGAEILAADHLVRAVFVGEGKHTVTFRYRPLSVRVGLWVSGVTLLGMCGVLLYTLL